MAIEQENEKDKYLGYPDDFYMKQGKTPNENKKEQWLIHQHAQYRNMFNLYFFIENRSNGSKAKSREAILTLKNTK